MNIIDFRFPIVIDNGSFQNKIGFVGEMIPRSVIPTLIAENHIDNQIYFGSQAIARLCDSKPIFPIILNQIQNYEKLLDLWRYELKTRLKVQLERSPFLITDTPQTENRVKLTEMLFESLNIPSLFYEYPAVLSLFGAGFLTGMGFDSGHCSTHIAAVFNGKIIEQSIIKVPVGGQTLTQKLRQSIQIQFPFNNNLLEEILRDIKVVSIINNLLNKETYCVMPNENQLVKREIKISMPDGQIIVMNKEKYEIVESLIKEYEFHKLPIKCLQQCQPELRTQIFNQVIFSGGNFKFRNLSQRLGQEIFQVSPPKMDFGAFFSNDSQLLPWKGGSILGSLSSFSQIWVTQQQYKEQGINTLYRHAL